jgi:hypothetical protein
MSVIDRSWSEPRGVPAVAPEKLATGTAAHAAAAFEDTEPRRFLGMPVIAPRTAPRAGAPPGRLDHDATSLVDPLPAPSRPGTHDRSAPRVAAIADEHTARSRQRRSDHHRRRVAILAGAIAGVALACGAMVISSREPDRQTAAQPQRQEPPPPQQQRAAVPAAVPAAAPAAPVKPRRATTAAPKKTAAAPKKTAADPKTTAVAPKKTAAAPKRTAAKQPAPAAKQPAPAAKQPAPAAKQPAPTAKQLAPAKLAGR